MPPKSKADGRHASSIRVTRATAMKNHVDEVGIDGFNFEDDTEQIDESAQWLDMIQDLKSKKKAGPSTASTQRTRQLGAVAKEAREQAAEFAAETNAYLDTLLNMYPAARVEEGAALDWQATFQAGVHHAGAVTEAVVKGVKLTPRSDPEGHNLPQRREDDIERACARLEAYPDRRRKTHNRQLRALRGELDHEIEKQRIAADAKLLIKNYQGLVRRTRH